MEKGVTGAAGAQVYILFVYFFDSHGHGDPAFSGGSGLMASIVFSWRGSILVYECRIGDNAIYIYIFDNTNTSSFREHLGLSQGMRASSFLNLFRQRWNNRRCGMYINWWIRRLRLACGTIHSSGQSKQLLHKVNSQTLLVLTLYVWYNNALCGRNSYMRTYKHTSCRGTTP